jgi:predicted alpha/beta-hydrolase family hydrolase
VKAPQRPSPPPIPFHERAADGLSVRGALHASPDALDGLVLTHGAGSSSESALLVALAEALAGRGVAVLRCDLPFRQARPQGPPSPAGAARDRAGLRAAAEALARVAPRRIYIGGHSYGGRQASVLAVDHPTVAAALLLLAYPLHPPGRPAELRVAHFPQLRTPALFVHGTTDTFGAVPELRRALGRIPARTLLHLEASVGHDLGAGRRSRAALAELAARVAERWLEFTAGEPTRGGV